MTTEPLSTGWETWIPQDEATLCFVVKAGQILLIEKKRGLGAGKVNGPGGRIEPGESHAACAVRECQEELRITPLAPTPSGLLEFRFVDGYSLRCHVFRAPDYSGTPEETEEAVPLWASVEAVPYERMWADDRHWIPLMLADTWFHGRFVFDADAMVWGEINGERLPRESPLPRVP